MSDPRPTLYVDADACPVKAEIERAATRHQMPVVMVCNGGLRPSGNPLIRLVYVDQGLDVADQWIVTEVRAGDLVVTEDIPLASEVIAKGARVVQSDGNVLTETNIGSVRATRDLMTDMRSANPLGTSGSGRSFGKAERSRFSNVLDREIRQAQTPAK